jgi:hypothetical protein
MHITKSGRSIIGNMSKPGFKWLLFMPSPSPKDIMIPNLTLPPIVIPGLKMANLPIALRFGGGGSDGDHRGRIFGLGHTLKRMDSSVQYFRLDYHSPHGQNVKDAKYDEETGPKGYQLHIHYKKF